MRPRLRPLEIDDPTTLFSHANMSSPSSHRRIAVLVPGGVGDASSGMHIPVLRNLIQRLADTNEVYVYSLAPPNWRETSGSCGRARVRFLPLDHRGGALTKTWRLFNMCLRDHRSKPYDLVHGFWAIPCGATTVLLGKYLSIPSVVTFMGGETACLPDIGYGNMSRFSTKQITLWVGNVADELVALTQHQEMELRRFGRSRRNACIIPFGVDTDHFAPGEKDISIRPLRLLHVSNINSLKDQVTLLRAFHVVCASTDARLRIVGADQSNGTFRQLAEDLHLTDKVEIVGYVPHVQMVDHYHWAHFLVHTSKHEAQGVVVAEAAATGVLVAGSRTGLLADFGDECVLTAPAGDYETLAKKILDTLGNPGRYDHMRRAAQAWAQIHDESWSVSQYFSMYDRLLASAKKALL